MPTPDQKRQAAAIFTAASEGKTIQFNQDGQWIYSNPFHFGVDSRLIAHPEQFRIAPDPIAPGHNPDKLTVSQVGEGWRLLEEPEVVSRIGNSIRDVDFWSYEDKWHHFADNLCPIQEQHTYRTRLSVSALAALDAPENEQEPLCTHCGKRHGQHRTGDGRCPLPVGHYIWHETNTFSPKPAWRPPAGGPPWHREDFTEADLPEGWRPLLKGEKAEIGDEWKTLPNEWTRHTRGDYTVIESSAFHRTKRPLPTTPRTRPWSKPEDVPGPVCWLRNGPHDDSPVMVIGFRPDGLDLYYNAKFNFVSWSELAKFWQYSLDRKTWAKCETTEVE